jgi:putative hydrolase of HD superfamily
MAETALDRLKSQIEFILEIDRLKTILRKTYLLHADRHENSAEHSWHLAMLAIILAEHTDEPVNVGHVLKMVLVHDIVEIDAGDTFAYDVAGNAVKAKAEQRAADRIFALLPNDQAKELRALWDEFESASTPEARFARAIDRAMPMLHNYYTGGRTWREHCITADRILARNQEIADSSTVLWNYLRALIEKAVEAGQIEAGSYSKTQKT